MMTRRSAVAPAVGHPQGRVWQLAAEASPAEEEGKKRGGEGEEKVKVIRERGTALVTSGISTSQYYSTS